MSLSLEEIKNRVTYHPPTPVAVQCHDAIRRMISDSMDIVTNVVPDGREQSLAITKLEEAMFWSNAGVARNHDKL